MKNLKIKLNPDLVEFIMQDRQEVLDKVKSDLLEIADNGELEDLRREVENYFNNLKK